MVPYWQRIRLWRDRFRVTEWCLLLMLSYLHLELLRLVRARPLVSVAARRDRY